MPRIRKKGLFILQSLCFLHCLRIQWRVFAGSSPPSKVLFRFLLIAYVRPYHKWQLLQHVPHDSRLLFTLQPMCLLAELRPPKAQYKTCECSCRGQFDERRFYALLHFIHVARFTEAPIRRRRRSYECCLPRVCFHGTFFSVAPEAPE